MAVHSCCKLIYLPIKVGLLTKAFFIPSVRTKMCFTGFCPPPSLLFTSVPFFSALSVSYYHSPPFHRSGSMPRESTLPRIQIEQLLRDERFVNVRGLLLAYGSTLPWPCKCPASLLTSSLERVSTHYCFLSLQSLGFGVYVSCLVFIATATYFSHINS